MILQKIFNIKERCNGGAEGNKKAYKAQMAGINPSLLITKANVTTLKLQLKC